MKSATLHEMKEELAHLPPGKVTDLVLTLARFKKENKELLTYLLYEAGDEAQYIANVKKEMDALFDQMNTTNFYLIKKSVRKILRTVKKYCRYSKNKETEAALMLYFCSELQTHIPSYISNVALTNLYNRQLDNLKKTIAALHDDLQFDYTKELERLK